MNDAESRALRRAAIVLGLVSAIRWGSAQPLGDPASGVEAVPDVGAELAAATRVATEDAESRNRPLSEGERVDPNRADAATLDRLPGVGPATAAAIERSRADGLVFRRTDDLLAVRGVGPALLRRIGPHLDWSLPPPGARQARSGLRRSPSIDVNRADVEALQALPGVGPTIAARILAARAERPFQSLSELTRVPGIGPATVERLRGLTRAGRHP